MKLAYKHLETKKGITQKPVTEITGTGIRVFDILGLYEAGDTPEGMAEGYGIPLSSVFEALAYAHDHPEEMAALRKASRVFATRIEDPELLSRVRELLKHDYDIP